MSEKTDRVDQNTLSEPNRKQIDATIKFAEYLTQRYPQVDGGQLNYYFAGSLATTLLSQVNTIEICEETDGSNINVVKSLTVPDETKKSLTEFARPIGDIDYIPTQHYRDLQKEVQDLFGKVTSEEYQRGRSKLLWKGGGGPSFDEIPTDAVSALKRGENSLKVMCDPVETYGTKKFARINVNNQNYYVARPDVILGYKVLHMLQSYDLKSDKFNSDFPKLLDALKGLYSEEDLVSVGKQIISEYGESIERISEDSKRLTDTKLTQMTKKVLENENLDQKSKDFIRKVIAR